MAQSLRLEDAAAKLGLAASTLSRIETGKAPVRLLYLASLLDLYGVNDSAQRNLLARMGREGQQKDWWAGHAHILPAAACRAARPAASSDVADAVAALQRQRQDRLRLSGAQLRLILDESALLRRVGSARIMAQQLEHVLATAATASASVRVIRLTADGVTASPSFALLMLPGETAPRIACTKGISGQVHLSERPADVAAATAVFHAKARSAEPEARSAALIEKAAALWRGRITSEAWL